jgi:hypothetical protein
MQLSLSNKQKIRVPLTINWYWTQDKMMDDAPDGSIMFAWDKSDGGKKVYGSHNDAAVFFRALNNAFNYGYELIQEHKPCPLYLDIEWVGTHDVDHQRMRWIAAKIREYCSQFFDCTIDINVACSSRPCKDEFKNSYHVVCKTIVFENNHDGTMKKFVTDLCEGEEWYYAPTKCYVDLGVYTRNRLFRLPFCSKFGADTPFYRISQDAFDDDFTALYDDPTDSEAWEPFILSNPEIHNGDVIMFPSQPIPAKVKAHPKVARSTFQTRFQWTSDAFKVSDLESLLYDCGDVYSNVTKITDMRSYYHVQCEQRRRGRICLHNCTTRHRGNNCNLHVIPKNDGRCEVRYYCTSKKCCDYGFVHMGFIPGKKTQTQVVEDDDDDEPIQPSPSDPKFDISIDYMAKTINRYMSGIRNKNSYAVLDALIKINMVYGKGRVEFQTVCFGALLEHATCSEQELHDAWNARVSQVFDRLYLSDPMADLRSMYLRDSIERLSGRIPAYLQQALQTDMENHDDYVSIPQLDHRVIALKAQCGMGKTKAMHDWLRTLSPQCIVFITHRKTLSRDAFQRLPQLQGGRWVIYNTIHGPIYLAEHRFVIIQFESLSRLIFENCADITIIMDEVCSIFKQMNSGAGDSACSQIVFSELCLRADHVLAMDGHLDQLRVDVLNRYCKSNAYVIHNTFQRKLDQNHVVRFTDDRKSTIEYIVDQLSKGEKIHCPCLCKEVAKQIHSLIKTKFGDSKVALLYTSEDQMDPEVDINEEWSKADIVIHTCTIDCGVSFERQHFGLCVSILNNRTKVDFETSAQMMARSRTIQRHVVCIEQVNFTWKDSGVQAILNEMQPNTIRMHNASYFGVNIDPTRSRDSKDKCCPYLLCHAANESITRRAANDFTAELTMLLLQEGAECVPMDFLADMPDLTVELAEAKIAITDASIEYLCDEYKGTHPEVFHQMGAEKRAMYASKRVMNTFKRLNLLRSNGHDNASALATMKAKGEHISLALQACASSSRFDQVSLTMAEIKSGVRGGNSEYMAFHMTCETLALFTGINDPFGFTQIYQSEVQTRLQCETWEDKLHLSQGTTRTLLMVYSNWMGLDPIAYTPYHIVYAEDRLSFTKAMTILNQMLKCMYLMTLISSEKKKRTSRGESRDYLLIMDKNSYFVEPNNDSHASVPLLDNWKSKPSKLFDQDVLQTRRFMDKQLLAASDSYLPSNASGEYDNYRPIQADDVFDLLQVWHVDSQETHKIVPQENDGTDVQDVSARLLSICRNGNIGKTRGVMKKTNQTPRVITDEMRRRNKLAKQKERQLKAAKLEAAQKPQTPYQPVDYDAISKKRKRDEIEKEKNVRKLQKKVANRSVSGEHLATTHASVSPWCTSGDQ